MSERYWQVGLTRRVALGCPVVMAILNVTPDSFSDGGSLSGVADAVAAARGAAEAGAVVIDVGGESTRPGASRVSPEEQIARVVPVIAAIRAAGGVLAQVAMSVDTTLEPVARAALDAGADVINDVSAGLDDPAVFRLAAEREAGLVLMHRLRPPGEDSYSDRYAQRPEYGDVVRDVGAFLLQRAAAAMAAGVAREAIVLDPGLGFGKSVEQNLELVRRTGELVELGFPILSGASRKSFVGRVAADGGEPRPPRERVAASVALSVMHLAAGARVFRVHDVREQVEGLRAAWAVVKA